MLMTIFSPLTIVFEEGRYQLFPLTKSPETKECLLYYDHLQQKYNNFAKSRLLFFFTADWIDIANFYSFDEILDKIAEYRKRRADDFELCAFAFEKLYEIPFNTTELHPPYETMEQQREAFKLYFCLIIDKVVTGFWNPDLYKNLKEGTHPYNIFKKLDESYLVMRAIQSLIEGEQVSFAYYGRNHRELSEKYLSDVEMPVIPGRFKHIKSLNTRMVSRDEDETRVYKGTTRTKQDMFCYHLENEMICSKVIWSVDSPFREHFIKFTQGCRDHVMKFEGGEPIIVPATETRLLNVISSEFIRGSNYGREIMKMSLRTNIQIYIQIFTALEWAYQEFDFTHYDLTPSNIMLKHCVDRPKPFSVPDSDISFTPEEAVFPVIVDLERSHYQVDDLSCGGFYVVDDIHYLNIHWDKSYPAHDILKMLMTLYDNTSVEMVKNVIEKNYGTKVESLKEMYGHSMYCLDRRPDWEKIRYRDIILDLWEIHESL